ncbi:MAG: TIM barrel protein [Chitinophagaceae bacterium]|nr:TIM barrel protein [Chitinophagaceae bacterium]
MSNSLQSSRRTFIRNAFITGAALPLIDTDVFGSTKPLPAEKLKVYIFSKHLQFLNYKELADAVAEMGFDGIDLSVRPGGHVEPERVEGDLPKAAEAMKKAGLSPALMTTGVNGADDPTDRKLLATASGLGFKYYRMNWYHYPENKSMPDAIAEFGAKLKNLAAFNKELNIKGYYQNHSGANVGSNIWEIYEMLKDADGEYLGAQYDIRHAIVEGSQSWENGLKLISQRIQTISLKDFKWKNEGESNVQDVPIGDGVINFDHYFKLLKQYNVSVPVSMHIEYPLGGAEHGDTKITMDRKDVFKAMKKDLKKIHDMWEKA